METLDRMYDRKVRQKGGLVARLWYWRQALEFWGRLNLHNLRRDATGVASSPSGLPPIQNLEPDDTVDFSQWMSDLRYALRRLASAPLLTAAVVVSLALAVGANGAIFGAVRSLLLTPLPYQAPEELVRVWGSYQEQPGRYSLSYPNYAELAAVPAVDDMAAWRSFSYTLGGGERPERVVGYRVTDNFFRVMGVEPVPGRGFRAGEGGPGGARVVVLSHRLWQSHFSGDPGVLGQTVSLDAEPFTVIGVAPPDFDFPSEGADLWVPLLRDESNWGRASGGLHSVARLAPGATLEEARSQLADVAARIAAEHSQWYEGWESFTLPLTEAVYGPEVRRMLYTLGLAVGLLLLVACVNVANLLLAQATTRKREVAVRAALGAARKRILRLFMIESVTLGVGGGLAGVAVAMAGLVMLRRAAPQGIARVQDMQMDPWAAAFTLILAALAGVVFGLVPAVRASRAEVAAVLKSESRGQTDSATGRGVQRLLVAGQVALVLVVLVSGGLVTRSLMRLASVDPGFETENVLVFALSLTSDYDEPPKVNAFRRDVLTRLRALPGARGAGAVAWVPMGGAQNTWDIYVEGADGGGSRGARRTTGANYASPGYFETMEIPVLQGRTFTPGDRLGSPRVTVVSQAAATSLWPGEDPLGKRVALPGERTDDDPGWRTVVGVVGDVRHGGLTADPRGEMYLPFAQLPWTAEDMVFTIKARSAPGSLSGPVRDAVRAVDPGQAPYALMPLSELVAGNLADTRSLAWLLGVFGLVALVMAAVGVFGVVSYGVAQRRHEMGIRAALGADRRGLFSLMLVRGLGPVVAGIAVGLPLAWGAAGLLEGLLYEVTALDPVTLVVVPAMLLATAVTAVAIPARRASRQDPLEALSAE